MASAEPIIVVLGPRCGGTSAVAGVLHHLGVFMGADFVWAYRGTYETWEDSRLSQLCVRAFSGPGDQLQMDASSFQAKLQSWADEHRLAARGARRRPGAKDPLLCLAIDVIRDAGIPIVPVVVDRPVEKVVASLNQLGWLTDERERADTTANLIATRDQALAGAATVRVDFEELRAKPAVVIRRLADELGIEVTEAQLKAAEDSVMKPADVPRDVDPNQRFIELLRPAVTPDSEDVRQVSMLAQVYFQAGDFANARNWFARMIEIGGSDEGTFWAMLRVAQSMEMLGEPWPDVHDAYLLAWEFRPTRAEPLYDIVRHYIAEKRAQLGYLYAQRAAEIQLPEDDMTIPNPDLYAWRTTFQQLVCAYHIDKQVEAFTLSRRLLARPDIPDEDRQGIASIRDLSVPTMLEAATSYPDVLAHNLIAGSREAEVTVSLVAGADRAVTEQTLNSFLHCCTDVSRAGRFLVVDAGLSAQDRAILQEGYKFLEFADCAPGTALRDQIHGRYWLHLGQGWRFFAPENLIARLTAVLDAETEVFQVGINLDDAVTLTGTSAPEQTVRRTPDAGRYVLADVQAKGPAMFDTARLDQPGGTASLDEVLCITAI
jgi:hypothetical protein